MRRQRQQILPRQQRLTALHLVVRMAGQGHAQRALAAAVGAHQHDELAGLHVQRYGMQHGALANVHAQVAHLQQGWGVCHVGSYYFDSFSRFIHKRYSPFLSEYQPTAPSSDTASRALASRANSIGSSSSTAWQKPPTISAVASCASMPRCSQ